MLVEMFKLGAWIEGSNLSPAKVPCTNPLDKVLEQESSHLPFSPLDFSVVLGKNHSPPRLAHYTEE